MPKPHPKEDIPFDGMGRLIDPYWAGDIRENRAGLACSRDPARREWAKVNI